VPAKGKPLFVYGSDVEVFKTKIKIYYTEEDYMSDLQAEKIIAYLYHEGFVEKVNIICELICLDDDD
tara:strand:- start:19 stop:219 length:201 start_codon:yes stop_codon:yes gene_type:complete